jgi:hypothetical protein
MRTSEEQEHEYNNMWFNPGFGHTIKVCLHPHCWGDHKGFESLSTHHLLSDHEDQSQWNPLEKIG